MRINRWLMLLLCCGAAMLAMCPMRMPPARAAGFEMRLQSLGHGAGREARTAHGQNGRATQGAEQAERALRQAEQQPAASGKLVRQAAELAPAHACPSLKSALENPTRENLTQARREVAACARAMSLDTSRAGTPFARRAPHDVLRTVLTRGEYQILKPTIRPGWMRWIGNCWNSLGKQCQRMFSAIKGLVARLFGHVHMPAWHPQTRWMAGLGGVLRWVLIFVLIAAIAFLLILLINRLLLRSLNRAAGEVRSELLDGVAPVSRKQEPTYWERSLQEAETLWQQGDQRKALRTVYWACLVLLDSRGVLHFDEGRANGEVLRELRRQGFTGVHDRFRPIIRCFDRSWYGFLNVSQEEFMQVLEDSRQFRGTVVKEP